MELVPGFVALLQPFALTMTAPTFHSFVTIAHRLGARQPADRDADDPGGGRRGREALLVLPPACSARPAGRSTRWGWRCST